MSFFDPYHVSEYTGYYSKKGQVIQKRHVERNPALSLKDKEKAIKILRSFGYKAVPDDYMPLEKYNMFEGRTLSYENIGELGPGESFQIKLRQLSSFLPNLPIFNQVSYINVEEFNIETIVTGIYFRSNTDPIQSTIRFNVGDGVYSFQSAQGQLTGTLRVVFLPNINNGFVNKFYSNNYSQGGYDQISVPNARKGQLTDNVITGDRYLFNAITKNDFSDARFDANILEILNDTSTSGDIVNLSEIGIFFSVNVEVIYKSYLD